MEDDLLQYGDVGDIYERYSDVATDPTHAKYPVFLAELVLFAEAGHSEAAESLGEELSRPGPHYRPDEAYKWYFIGLFQNGYSIDWVDHNNDPPYYCGKDGDFRNESMVSELVVELGWDRVRQLDSEATQWLTDYGLTKR